MRNFVSLSKKFASLRACFAGLLPPLYLMSYLYSAWEKGEPMDDYLGAGYVLRLYIQLLFIDECLKMI